MGFFSISWGKNKEKRSALDNPGIPLTAATVDEVIFNESRSDSVRVTPDSSLGLPAFYRGLRVRSGLLASMQWNVIENTPEGKQIAEKSPAQAVIQNPNDIQTPFSLKELSQTHADIFGDGLIEIVRDRMGRPKELWHVDSRDVELIRKGRKIAYHYQPADEKSRFILPADIVHLKNFSLDGFFGLGLIDVAKKTIGHGLNGQAQASNYISKNGIPPGILTWNGAGRLKDEVKKASKKSWDKSRREGGTAVLDGGWDYRHLIIPPDQMQFLQSRDFSVVDIARMVGIEPHILFNFTGSTYSNIEQQNLNLIQFTLKEIVKRWEEELNRKLLSYSEQKAGNIGVRFNLNSLLRGDSTSRSNLYRQLWSLGAMNAEKIAELEDLPKPKGGETYWVQQGFAPADKPELFGNQNNNTNGQRKTHIFNGVDH